MEIVGSLIIRSLTFLWDLMSVSWLVGQSVLSFNVYGKLHPRRFTDGQTKQSIKIVLLIKEMLLIWIYEVCTLQERSSPWRCRCGGQWPPWPPPWRGWLAPHGYPRAGAPAPGSVRQLHHLDLEVWIQIPTLYLKFNLSGELEGFHEYAIIG